MPTRLFAPPVYLPLWGGLLPFLYFFLHLNKVVMELHSGSVCFFSFPPGMAVFFILNNICCKNIRNLDELPLGYGIVCLICIVRLLIYPHIEALNWLVQVVWLTEAGGVLCKVSEQNMGVITAKMNDEANSWDWQIFREGVIEGGQVCILKDLEELVIEVGVYHQKFVVFPNVPCCDPWGAVFPLPLEGVWLRSCRRMKVTALTRE